LWWGLTGSILAFWQAIDESLNKEMMIVGLPAGGAYFRPLDEIFAAANEVAPPHSVAGVLSMPRHANAAVAVSYTVPTPEVSIRGIRFLRRQRNCTKRFYASTIGFSRFHPRAEGRVAVAPNGAPCHLARRKASCEQWLP
jgi:hypothetical protein